MAFDGQMYPSKYSVARIAVTSVFVTALMVVVVVGNMLVIIAIATEKALKVSSSLLAIIFSDISKAVDSGLINSIGLFLFTVFLFIF
jgi:hypothetical protein